MWRHRDLGPRYLAEGTTNSGRNQLRTYGIGFILGLAALGYVQAANTLMGPFMVIFFGMGLVTVAGSCTDSATSPRHLPLFCLLASGGLALLGLAWGVVLLVALPRGLGHLMLGSLWRPTYPLVLPSHDRHHGRMRPGGAGTGLHALGAARRSLRAMVLASVAHVVCGVGGAIAGGALGATYGAALATWIGALLFWWQLRATLREFGDVNADDGPLSSRQQERHRKPVAVP